MREVVRCCVPAVAIALAPVVAEGLRLTVSALPLAFALAFALAATFPTPLRGSALPPKPFGGFFVNFPFFRFAGRISRSVASNTTSVTPHLLHPGLGVPIHDREARVFLFFRLIVHLTSSPFSKLIGIDEFLAQLCVVRKVIGSVVTLCVAFTVRNCFQLSSHTVFPQRREVLDGLHGYVIFCGQVSDEHLTQVSSSPSS